MYLFYNFCSSKEPWLIHQILRFYLLDWFCTLDWRRELFEYIERRQFIFMSICKSIVSKLALRGLGPLQPQAPVGSQF